MAPNLKAKTGEVIVIGEHIRDVQKIFRPVFAADDLKGAVFVGDTLFMPDDGTARADFPGGDARQLYRSGQRLLIPPRETLLFRCHDYKAPGRDVFV